MSGIYKRVEGGDWIYTPVQNAIITNTNSTSTNMWSGNFSDYIYRVTTRLFYDGGYEDDFYYAWDGISEKIIEKTIYLGVDLGQGMYVFKIEINIMISSSGQITYYMNDIVDGYGTPVFGNTSASVSLSGVNGTDVFFSYSGIFYRNNASAEYNIELAGFGFWTARAYTKTTAFGNYSATNFFQYNFYGLAEYPDWDGNFESDLPTDDDEFDGSLGEPSTPQGGNGSFDNSSDDVTIPELPYIPFAQCGIMSMYSLNIAQVNNFNYWLFQPDTFDKISRILTEPMDYLIGLEYFPFQIEGTLQNIKYGGAESDVQGLLVSTSYMAFDFGEYDITEFWGGFMDYSPNTAVDLYLPYHGTVALNVDEVMDSVISIRYVVDLFTGMSNIFVSVNKKNAELNSIMYNFDCKISSSFSLTSQNYTSQVNAIIGAVGSLSMGALVMASGGTAGVVGAIGMAGSVGASAGSVVSGSKPSVNRSGSVGGNSGLTMVQYPYLIFSRPIQSRPSNYNELIGYQSEIYSQFDELEGFTIVRNCELENIGCTDSELTEIKEMLQNGVVF